MDSGLRQSDKRQLLFLSLFELRMSASGRFEKPSKLILASAYKKIDAQNRKLGGELRPIAVI